MRWTEAGLALALAGLAGSPGQNTHPTPAQAPQAPGAMPPAAQPATTHPFVVVLDAAHGGSDEGARLGKTALEKTLTLTMAEHLQALLRQQGIVVTMTRTADVDLPALNRAQIANHAQAAVCLVFHATATGSGVHLFTSSLPAPQAVIAGGLGAHPGRDARRSAVGHGAGDRHLRQSEAGVGTGRGAGPRGDSRDDGAGFRGADG